MTRPLAILLLLLAGCSGNPIEQGNPSWLNKPLVKIGPVGAEVTRRGVASVAPTSLTFTIHPPTSFQILASPTLSTPRTNWIFIAAATNQITLPLSAFAAITNNAPPVYQQTLAWNALADTNLGVNLYSGSNSGAYTQHSVYPPQGTLPFPQGTNSQMTLYFPSSNLNFYAATCFEWTNKSVEGPFSLEVSANPTPVLRPTTLFFAALANLPTTLTISAQ